MGKAHRQNRYTKWLEAKIRKFEKRGKSTEGLKKELGYMTGDPRPTFKTGSEASPGKKKY